MPSYTRVSYDFSDLNLMLRFKVENLFDKEYWVSAGAKGMDWNLAPGNGGLVSLSANYRF
ncbi:TonB-dependent receptor [Pseudoalteromonas sp. MMG023]|nr:TonB-dependent receptor [Pseudoalteromonas sp. MMG024]MCF6455830.1 TonB-dependent receptor [Pseudoalteromonas sp. MMG024]